MGCSIGVNIGVMVKGYQISWMLKLFYEEHRSGAEHCIGSAVLVSAPSENLTAERNQYEESKQSDRIVTESRQ